MIKKIIGLVVALIIIALAYICTHKTDKTAIVHEEPLSNLEYFTIQELGIKFLLTEDLHDLTYFIHEYPWGEKVAKLTSGSLIGLDIKSGGSSCQDSGLGYITLYRLGDNLYNQAGYYNRPQDRCNADESVSDYQRKLQDSLDKAFKTSVPISI